MRSVSPFSRLDDRAFAFAPHGASQGPSQGPSHGSSYARGSGEVGAAAASGRRAQTAARAFPDGAGAEKRTRAPGAVTLVLAGFAAWAMLIGGRTQIVRLVPAVAPLYATLGLDVNLRRMGVEHVSARLVNEDGRQVLIVSGEIDNLSSSPRAAPRMRFAVIDADGGEIYHWTAAPPKARLAAGETAEFRARLAAPPKEGHEIRVRFARDSDSSGASSSGASW
ncbi:DUF3426 domain-containing protein [Rhodoblastus acidophilus]|uniref:DUF3426 domain-containing protein n=1 Tax=Candidatus Rhodoblastus alkanivorans TaxID=2954117 RepID=A0ABS9Z166_9HYPH|nr:DUF3426 domain-containing protein [Candidatus Rhodoblastus alkanivorans]MCI4678554.1 DUF3426 domain-containing protein [Candidatus Rhodoblastus alkanivorans]MCI4681358.1 DUF3426 domain-containing protein [Candidatus Rhodoblastus alkanivorans]MDI4642406.1 DUF3426 domain-containing protein [Rhodoblastus acidophilus]